MKKIRLLASFGFGVLTIAGMGIVDAMDLGPLWDQYSYWAAVAFLAGCLDLTTAGFFAGLLFVALCIVIPGFFGDAYDRIMTAVAGSVLILLVFLITGVSFFLGKAANVGICALQRRLRDQAAE